MFAPIASFALLPHVMIVPEHVPAKTVAEFIAYAKANAGKLNYGGGLGTPPYLLSSLFVRRAGLDITYRPSQGAAQSVNDLLGGRTHFLIDGTVILLPQVRAGKFRAIAMARAERWPELPNVPTLVESGFPEFVIDAWTGLVAPAGTPEPILAKLNAAINTGLRSAEAKTTLDRFSSIAKTGTPADFGAFIADQGQRWGALVKLTAPRSSSSSGGCGLTSSQFPARHDRTRSRAGERKMRRVLLAAVLTMLGVAPASATMIITADPGGPISQYERRYASVRAAGETVVIDGACFSACTLVLGLVPPGRVCVTPRARLGFHAAWFPDMAGGRVISPAHTRRLHAAYPEPVRSWIARRGGLSTRTLVLKGRELRAILPACRDAAGPRTLQPARPATGHTLEIWAAGKGLNRGL